MNVGKKIDLKDLPGRFIKLVCIMVCYFIGFDWLIETQTAKAY